MGYQVIPFKLFVIAPSAKVVAGINFGLPFFAGVGVTLFALAIAEKMGLPVNKTAVRWTVRVSVALFVLWAVHTSGLLHHVMFGY